MCMRVLPNIELTEEQYDYICKYNYFGEGAESDIYKISKKNIAKIWSSGAYLEIENKFQKIKALYQIEELEQINDIKIISSISYNGEIIGYQMTFSRGIPYYKLSKYRNVSRKEKLEIFMRTRQKIKQFADLGIIYCDIHEGNILIGRHRVTFCDLDNVAIPKLGLEIDARTKLNDIFLREYGKFDEKISSFVLNMFTLQELCFLNLVNYRRVFKKLKTFSKMNAVPIEFEPERYYAILEQMSNITPEYEGLYLTDYVKPTYKSLIK